MHSYLWLSYDILDLKSIPVDLYLLKVGREREKITFEFNP